MKPISMPLRFFGTIVSGSLQRLFSDPTRFGELLNEYLRRRLGIDFSNFFRRDYSKQMKKASETNELRLWNRVGHPSLVIEKHRRLPGILKLANAGARYTAESMKTQISRRIVSSSGWQSSPATRVAFFVNNAEPYTNSGYTFRTAELLAPLSEFTDGLLLITRLGYPAVIGRYPQPTATTGVTHLIPWFLPFSQQRRFELAIKLLVQQCRNAGITVLHTTSDYTNAQIVSAAAQELSIPWVYEVRGQPHLTWLAKIDSEDYLAAVHSEYLVQSERLELESARQASHVIALSELSRAMLIEGGVEPGKVSVLPNAVDAEILQNQETSEDLRESEAENRFIVGVVGALVGYEGIDYLIAALDQLPSEVELLIVGEGFDRRRLESLAHQSDSASRITFAGFRPREEMVSWYRKIDVLAVPRIDTPVTREVTPLKPLVALALGTPIVASDLPALREVTGGYARFVQPESAESLAHGILDIMSDPNKWVPPQDWIRDKTWKKNATKLHEIYSSLLTESR